MIKTTVALVAYQDQENLGVSYLASMLTSRDIRVVPIELGPDNHRILRMIEEADPDLVGFSLIFQYDLSRVQELTAYLRRHGIECHFTIGGHYPSLRYSDVLTYIPELDSVVRFEGELTLLELVDSIALGNDWRSVRGLAYTVDGRSITNDLRPLVDDLDTLPFPSRHDLGRYHCLGLTCAFLLASRGCTQNCSFCSIRKFYGAPPGRIRRNRTPGNVVAEMKQLYSNHNVRIFLFQDDDFIPPGHFGRRWLEEFCTELRREELLGEIMWKISCRADDVSTDVFAPLKDSGLTMVYLGIESGNLEGLDTLNKGSTVEDNLQAVETLKRMGMVYSFGFMLLDPSSTFSSIRNNVAFLERICGDGSTPVTYCKMAPYAETDVEEHLRMEGRLKGSVVNPDYDLLDPRLDELYLYLHEALYRWIFSPSCFKERLQWYQLIHAVVRMFDPLKKELREYEKELWSITKRMNSRVLTSTSEAIDLFEDGEQGNRPRLVEMRRALANEYDELETELRRLTQILQA